MAALDPQQAVFTVPITITTGAEGAAELETRVVSFVCASGLLPPSIQQRIGLNLQAGKALSESPEAARIIAVRPPAEGTEDGILVHGVNFRGLPSPDDPQEVEAFLAHLGSQPLWRGGDPELGADTHVVLQPQKHAIGDAPAARSNSSQVHFRARYQPYPAEGRTGRTVELQIPSSLTGLQLKSMVISACDLDGGFQNYIMAVDGEAFGSRVPVVTNTSFRDGCEVVIEDLGDRPKRSGRT